jgi:hypothetical protein
VTISIAFRDSFYREKVWPILMLGQDLEAQVGPYGILLTGKSENYNS